MLGRKKIEETGGGGFGELHAPKYVKLGEVISKKTNLKSNVGLYVKY